MPLLTVSLFGPFTASIDGTPIASFRSVSVQALFIYLLAESNQIPHSREMLSELIWPGMPSASSRKNLRQALYELRQAIPYIPLSNGESGPVAIADRRTIQINPSGVFQTDIAQFEKLLLKKELDFLKAAADLYRGDFLSDFYIPGSSDFEAWAASKRAYYRRRALECMTAVVQLSIERASYAQAESYARRQLELDNLFEPAHRQLMQVLELTGRRSESLDQYDQLRGILRQELGADPSPATSALYKSILEGAFQPSIEPETALPRQHQPETPRVPDNLPLQATAFIGRETEIDDLQDRLLNDPDCRLMTLLGPGGSGKTRLAIEVANRIAQEPGHPFTDGIWFISLDKLEDPGLVPAAIAKDLPFNLLGEEDQECQLLDYLSQRSILLILDNYEQLLQNDGPPLAARILTTAPGVKVLVTSRSLLKARAERVHHVAGLAYPKVEDQLDAEEALSFDAVRLFQQSARRAQPDFEVCRENVAKINHVSSLLQGMPLAIELAASWIVMLSPQEIIEEIDRSLDFLEAQWRDVPKRQQSLRAVFVSSWEMLTGREKQLVGSLSIFRSSFSREAAQAVSGAALAELMSLSSKSWLTRSSADEYQIHVMLRQFGREKLQDNVGTLVKAKTAHATYYLSWLERMNLKLRGSFQREALDQIVSAFDDVRVALGTVEEHSLWTLLTDQSLAALVYFASGRDGFVRDVQFMIRRLREGHPDPEGNDRIYHVLGVAEASLSHGYFVPKYIVHWLTRQLPDDLILSSWQVLRFSKPEAIDALWLVLSALLYAWSDNLPAIDRLQSLVTAYRDGHNRWALAFALHQLGRAISQIQFPSNIRYLTKEERQIWNVADTSGMERETEVRRLLKEAISIWEELGDKMQHADALRLLAFNYARSDATSAKKVMEKAHGLYMELGDLFAAASVLRELAEINLHHGHIPDAIENYRNSRKLTINIYDRKVSLPTLSLESIHLARYGDLDHARHLRIENMAVARDLEEVVLLSWSIWEMGEIERLSGNLSEARRLYIQSRELFTQESDQVGLCFYNKGMGDLALMRADYREAQQRFMSALEYAVNANHDWSQVYSL
ncbi:MAG: BTAD domain-containing putative transcriptional regulator, partial [Candidatus Promineifilaceae bacterium]